MSCRRRRAHHVGAASVGRWLFALWALCAAAPAQAQDDESPLRLNLKLGLESDSNPSREEGPNPRGDVLTRYFLKASYAAAVQPGQRASARLLSGGKLFERVDREDALLNQVDLSYTALPLWSLEQRWLSLWARAGFKDRTERGSQRDYLRMASAAGLGGRWSWLNLSAGVGYGLFHYKPDGRLSSQGLTLEAQASASWSDDWLLALSWSQAQRGFAAPRFVQRASGDVVAQEERPRQDEVTAASASVTWRGPVILGLSATLLENQSNSYGQALRRYGGTLLLTAPLPWEIFVSARLGLLRTFFADRIFIIDDTLSINEENRNTLVIEVERPLWGALGLSASYSLYTQEFGASDADYLRQLLFAGVGVDY